TCGALARARQPIRYFRYPMLKRIAELSKAIVVHNPAAAEMVRQHATSAAIHEIPHLFEPPELPARYESERLRAQLGVMPHTLLAGVFGHLRESKRILPVVRAFAKARSETD